MLSSHKYPKLNDEFHQWLEKKYGDTNIGQVKAVRGKRHDYLAMNLDYQIPGVVKIDMVSYVKDIIGDFPEEVQETPCPWIGNIFKVDTNSPHLSKENAELFHTFVAKGLCLCKRARSDIQPAIVF
jgi:hypothetical protein